MANPVDAHRKALRKKELKKNKEARTKTREIATVKKDTRSLESDIRKLADAAQRGPLSASDKEQLASLRAELARIQKAKADYVEAHPEHRKFVFPDRKETAPSEEASGSETGLYGRDGKLRHPERSFYYDPVFNPFGAPPPGMPYRERAPTAEEIAAFTPHVAAPEGTSDGSGEDSDDEDDDDIPLPDGPPPPPSDSDSSSDEGLDDIPMPEGPPPPLKHFLPNRPSPMIVRPTGPPPRQFPQPFHPDPHMRHAQHFAPQQHRPLPPRPHHPGFVDPLSMGLPPKPTFQAVQAARHAPPPPPNAPPPPPPPTVGPATPGAGPFLTFPTALPTGGAPAATISAAPQLRDLKKEATAFVPTAMRKKKPTTAAATLQINATPGLEAAPSGEARASLKDALSGVGIGPEKPAAKKDLGKEDYERFQQQMQGFL